MIDTIKKNSIIKQKIKIVVCFFFPPKDKEDNIETMIKNSIINLREIKRKKH